VFDRGVGPTIGPIVIESDLLLRGLEALVDRPVAARYPDEFLQPQRLTDRYDGGLFGFRF
jgi:hypothetical protein